MEEQLKEILYNATLGKIVIIFFGIALIWIVIKLIQRRLFSKIKNRSDQYRARKLGSFLGYFLSILLFSVVFSDKLGGLTVAFGVAGAGVAFALQEVIASIAGWLAIVFGDFYDTGDRVELGGIKGDVMDIGVLRTTIMEVGNWVDGDLYNGRIVLVANSFVLKEPVVNYSGDFPFLWDEIKIPVQFGSNYEKAMKILREAGEAIAGDLSAQSKEKWGSLQKEYLLEDAQTEAMVSLKANENWVQCTLRYVVGYKKRRATKTALFKRILKDIDATNGEIKLAGYS